MREAEDDDSEARVDIAPALSDAPDASGWGMKLIEVCRPWMTGKLWVRTEAPETMGRGVRVVASEVGNEEGTAEDDEGGPAENNEEGPAEGNEDGPAAAAVEMEADADVEVRLPAG